MLEIVGLAPQPSGVSPSWVTAAGAHRWRAGFALLICVATVGCTLMRSAPDPREIERAGERDFVRFISRSGFRVTTEPVLTGPASRVAARVLDAARASGHGARVDQVQWRVTVIDAPAVANAFVTPSGRIVVFTGLFPMAQTEAGLAAVLGHEVAHVLEPPPANERQLSEREVWMWAVGLATLAGATAAAVAVGAATNNADAGSAVHSALTTGMVNLAAWGLAPAHPPDREVAADRLGVEFAARAGYDPREAVSVLQRITGLDAEHGASAPRQRPDLRQRLTALRVWSSDALLLYRGNTPGALDRLPDPAAAAGAPVPAPGKHADAPR